jgi:hypothetical protein
MRVIRLVWLLSLTLVVIAAGSGCGSSTGGGSGPLASHGGTLLELPNHSGFLELMAEKTDAKSKGRPVMGKVVAFFTNQAGNAALNPSPTDVVFIDEDGKRYPMSTRSDDSSAARFESQPILIADGEPTGTIEAKVGNEAVRLVNRPR